MVAHRRFFDTQSLTKEMKIVTGSFAPNSTSEVTDVFGKGFSVSRTDVGEFTLSLEDKYVNLISALAQIQLANGTDQFTVVGEYDSEAKTIKVYTFDRSGGAVVDIAADPNSRVSFNLYFQNTKLRGR